MYEKVYDAEGAPTVPGGHAAAQQGQPIAIRSDSAWKLPGAGDALAMSSRWSAT